MKLSKLELYYLVYDYDTWLSVKQNKPPVVDYSNTNRLKGNKSASCFESTNKYENSYYKNNFHSNGHYYDGHYNQNYYYEQNIKCENYGGVPFHEQNGFTYDPYPLDFTRKIKEENDSYSENPTFFHCPPFEHYRYMRCIHL